MGGVLGSSVDTAGTWTVALGGADGLPLFAHTGLSTRDTVLADRLREGMPTLLAENALGILLGPFGRLATIGAEVDAAGELELLIHRMYAECSVLASLRGPVLLIATYQQESSVVTVERKKLANSRLRYKLKDSSRASLLERMRLAIGHQCI
jgi:hypothetical protein